MNEIVIFSLYLSAKHTHQHLQQNVYYIIIKINVQHTKTE